jgi:hypothetical protein
MVRQCRRFADLRRTHRAAYASERRFDGLRIRGSGEARQLVKGSGSRPGVCLMLKVFSWCRLRQPGRPPLSRRTRVGQRYPLGLTPGQKQPVVSLVGPAGTRSLLRLAGLGTVRHCSSVVAGPRYRIRRRVERAVSGGGTQAGWPGVDIDVIHRQSPSGDWEQISINIRAMPSFEAIGRSFEAADPFALRLNEHMEHKAKHVRDGWSRLLN